MGISECKTWVKVVSTILILPFGLAIVAILFPLMYITEVVDFLRKVIWKD